jgi:hypothetical protein
MRMGGGFSIFVTTGSFGRILYGFGVMNGDVVSVSTFWSIDLGEEGGVLSLLTFFDVWFPLLLFWFWIGNGNWLITALAVFLGFMKPSSSGMSDDLLHELVDGRLMSMTKWVSSSIEESWEEVRRPSFVIEIS